MDEIMDDNVPDDSREPDISTGKKDNKTSNDGKRVWKRTKPGDVKEQPESVSVENAMGELLDKSQEMMKFPVENEKEKKEKASMKLHYTISAQLTAWLETDWTLFDGFTLSSVRLETAFSKTKGSPSTLSINLSALMRIGETDVEVSGKIPRLRDGTDTDFELTIKVAHNTEYFDRDVLIKQLGGDAGPLNQSLTSFDSTMSEKIDGDLLVASVTIRRVAKSGTYYLRSVRLDLATKIDWEIIKGRVKLTRVNIKLLLEKKDPQKPFDIYIKLGGRFLYEKRGYLEVTGELLLDKTQQVRLTIQAGPSSSFTPTKILSLVNEQSANNQALDKASLPPDVKFPSGGSDPFIVEIELQKFDSSWGLSHAYVEIYAAGLGWQPISWLRVNDIYFQMDVTRKITDPNTKTSKELVKTDKKDSSSSLFDYLFVFGGSFVLGDIPLAALVFYYSGTKRILVEASIPENTLGALAQIAMDPKLKSDQSTENHKLSETAKKNPAPESSPVSLDFVNDPSVGSERKCTLEFTEKKLTKLSFSAMYRSDELKWQLFPGLRVEEMGIYFSIDKPKEASTTKGFVFGSFLLGDKTRLFLFAAGIKDTKESRFVLNASLECSPDQPLGVSPTKLLTDPSIGAVTPKDKWDMPDSAPKDCKTDEVLSSVKAFVTVACRQKKEGEKSVTSLEAVRVGLDANGDWEIVSGLTLKQVKLTVIVIPSKVDTSGKQVADKPAAPVSSSESSRDAEETQTTASPDGSSKDWFVELSGCVGAKGGQNNYSIELRAMLKKVKDENSFKARISVISEDGSKEVSLAPIDLANLDIFGQKTVQKGDSVPDEFPVKPDELSKSLEARCELEVAKIQDKWELTYLTFILEKSDSWVIISDKLKLVKASLALQINKPRQKDSVYRFKASATFEIETFLVTGIVEIVKEGKNSGQMLIALNGSNAAGCIQKIADTDINSVISPSDLTQQSILDLSLYFLRNNGYKLTTLALRYNAGTGWKLGPFTILNIVLFIVFAETGKRIYFEGQCQVSGKTVTVSVLYVSGDSLQITFSGGVTCTDLAKEVGCDLGQAPSKPSLPDSAGLSNYESSKLDSGVEAVAVFKKKGSWSIDSLSLVIKSSETKWTLIPNTLWFTQIKLKLTIKDLSKDWKLEGSLMATFGYKQRPPTDTPSSKDLIMSATKEEFKAELDTTGCSFSQFLYVITAGYLSIPDFLPKAFVPGTVKATVNWKKKSASIEAIFPDWTLPDSMKYIASIIQPRLDLKLSGWGSGVGAEGWLRGTAKIIGIPVPVAYKLPKGPFTVFGIDVKKVYDLVKKLYNFLRSAGRAVSAAADAVGAVVGDLAAFGIAAFEIGADILGGIIAAVGLALGALGVAAGIVKGVLKGLAWLWDLLTDRDKGKHDDDDDDSSDSTDKDSLKDSDCLVVAGLGISPGAPNETVDLKVYPKTKGGRVWTAFDPKTLDVYTTINATMANASATKLALNWSAIKKGFTTNYTRPSENYSLTLEHLPVKLQYVIPVTPNFRSQLSTTNTIIRCPSSVLIRKPMCAEIWPRDQLNQPRYGLDKAENFKVTLLDSKKTEVKIDIVTHNDCFLLNFTLAEPGDYSLSVTAGTPISGSPFAITALLGLDSQFSFAHGEGVCSGLQGIETKFEISLRDSRGQPYKPSREEQTRFVTQMTIGSVPTDLALTFQDTKATVTYKRPSAALDPYIIDISFDGAPIKNAPYSMISRDSAVTVDMKQAVFDLSEKSLPVRANKPITGVIQLKDNFGDDWRASAGELAVMWSSGPKITTIEPAKDNEDGTYATNWSFDIAGEAHLQIGGDTGREIVLNIDAAPVYSNVGIHSLTTSQISLSFIDQYGTEQAWDASKVDAVAYSDGVAVPLDRVPNGYKFAKLPQVIGVDFLNEAQRIAALLGPYYGISTKSGSPKTSFLHRGQIYPSEIKYTTVTPPGDSVDIVSYLLVVLDEDGRRVYHGGGKVTADWGDAGNARGAIAGIADRLDGTYELRVMPKEHAKLGVYLNGQPIKDSPITLMENLYTGVRVSGEGWTQASAGEKALFEITFSDKDGRDCDTGVYSVSAVLFSRDYSFTQAVNITRQARKATAEYTLPEDLKLGTYYCRLLVNTLAICAAAQEIKVEDAPGDADVAVQGLPDEKSIKVITLVAAQCEPDWTGSFDVTLSNIKTSLPLKPKIITFQREPIISTAEDGVQIEFGDIQMSGTKFTVKYRALGGGFARFSVLCFKKKKFTTILLVSDAVYSAVPQAPSDIDPRWPSVPLQNYGFTLKYTVDADLRSNTSDIESATVYTKESGTAVLLNQPIFLPDIHKSFEGGLFVAVTLSLADGGAYQGFKMLPFIRPSCNIYPALIGKEGGGLEWRQAFEHSVYGKQLKISALDQAGRHTVFMFWSVESSKGIERLAVFENGQLVNAFQGQISENQDPRFYPQQSLLIQDETLTDHFEARYHSMATLPSSFRPSTTSSVKSMDVPFNRKNLKTLQEIFTFENNGVKIPDRPMGDLKGSDKYVTLESTSSALLGISLQQPYNEPSSIMMYFFEILSITLGAVPFIRFWKSIYLYREPGGDWNWTDNLREDLSQDKIKSVSATDGAKVAVTLVTGGGQINVLECGKFVGTLPSRPDASVFFEVRNVNVNLQYFRSYPALRK